MNVFNQVSGVFMTPLRGNTTEILDVKHSRIVLATDKVIIQKKNLFHIILICNIKTVSTEIGIIIDQDVPNRKSNISINYTGIIIITIPIKHIKPIAKFFFQKLDEFRCQGLSPLLSFD